MPAALPLRLLLITLLLVGLASAGDRHCDDAGIVHATAHAVDILDGDLLNVPDLHAGSHGSQNPDDLLGLCLVVLAGIAAALLLLARPGWTWSALGHLPGLRSQATSMAPRAPVLSQLCVLLT
jgi:hypothetical protein